MELADSEIKKFQHRLDMFNEKKRLETFESWKFKDNTNCTAIKMAQAGFYLIGSGDSDSATCFLCNKCLDGWEPSDEPWKEHFSHSKTCKFAKLQKTQSEYSILELKELYEMLVGSVISESISKINVIFTMTCKKNQTQLRKHLGLRK